MAYNRYRKREQIKRQFTFTKTKAFVGFLLSAAFSICLSAYFERYGVIIYERVKTLAGQSLESMASIPQLKPRALAARQAQRSDNPASSSSSSITPEE